MKPLYWIALAVVVLAAILAWYQWSLARERAAGEIPNAVVPPAPPVTYAPIAERPQGLGALASAGGSGSTREVLNLL